MSIPRTATVLLWVVCAAHVVTPVAIASGFLFALHLYGAVSLAPALVLAVGSVVAHGPALLVEVFGGQKERAAARIYVAAFWVALMAALVLLMIADRTGAAGDWGLARQAGGIAALGVLTTMIAHVKAAAEAVAAPTREDATGFEVADLLALVAAERTARAQRLPARAAHTALYGSAGSLLFAAGCLPLLGADTDSARMLLVLTAPTVLAAAGVMLAGWVRRALC